ncbi:MAG: FHA domain-containing protein [Anaerolineaceae bacterium]|nr:MAG: FHA domain-containing protein [Anaerolineaceae bacterium]
MDYKISVSIMSGAEDGNMLEYSLMRGDGRKTATGWVLTIGRHDENDIYLRHDLYTSRYHAEIICDRGAWYLRDLDSTNGTFFENPDDYFNERRIYGTHSLTENQLFRIGRTWLQFESIE